MTKPTHTANEPVANDANATEDHCTVEDETLELAPNHLNTSPSVTLPQRIILALSLMLLLHAMIANL